MEPLECQYHNNCGGWCETDDEREHCLCADCLEAEREADADLRHAAALQDAIKRIAVAAGVEHAHPNIVADVVCAQLRQHN